MKHTQNIKNLIAPFAMSAVVVAGLASAAATDPIPNPLPNAVAGNVIKASDINDLATAVAILDERMPGPIDLNPYATKDDMPEVPVFADHSTMVTAAQNAAAGDTFVFQGKEYTAVESPDTGKLWLDRNLGANRACESAIDTLCFGDLYQWGRDKDGHEYYTVTTNEQGPVDTITPDTARFVKSGSDWSSADADGAQRTAFLSLTDGTGVCPAGWRVPSEAELESERTGLVAGNTHFFNMPLSGHRNYSDASVNTQGVYGYLWSSTAVGDRSRNLGVNAGSSGWYTNHRGYGFSLRCLKD